MKRLILSAVLLLASLSQAHATSPEPSVVTDIRCVSGTVNPAGQWATGGLFSEPGVEYFAATHGGKVVTAGRIAVFTLPVSGDQASDCQNNGQPTILIVTMKK